VPTPVVTDDSIFLLSDKGQVSCLGFATGQQLWSFDLPKSRNTYYASPVLAGNTIYFTREDGVLTACEVNEGGLSLVAENNLGEQIIATPIPLRGQLLVRGSENLYLFR
jgi:outer membrane protein assembly factor BamB